MVIGIPYNQSLRVWSWPRRLSMFEGEIRCDSKQKFVFFSHSFHGSLLLRFADQLCWRREDRKPLGPFFPTITGWMSEIPREKSIPPSTHSPPPSKKIQKQNILSSGLSEKSTCANGHQLIFEKVQLRPVINFLAFWGQRPTVHGWQCSSLQSLSFRKQWRWI